MKNNNPITIMLEKAKAFFLEGLFAIIPISITFVIIRFTYNLIEQWLQPIRNNLPELIKNIQGSEIILIILFLLCLGILIHFLIITPLINMIEKIMSKIPLIKTIYGSAKTLVNFFNIKKASQADHKVVLVPYPYEDTYAIGFLLGSAENNFQTLLPVNPKKPAIKYYKIFMPTTPNPTTGFFIIYPEDKIVHTNLSFEEAIKSVVSCGIMHPEKMNKR